MRTVRNAVLEKRKKSGNTQEEVAQAIGVSRQTIIAIEKGNYTPSVALALDLALFFGCPVEEIFWYTQ